LTRAKSKRKKDKNRQRTYESALDIALSLRRIYCFRDDEDGEKVHWNHTVDGKPLNTFIHEQIVNLLDCQPINNLHNQADLDNPCLYGTVLNRFE
jgi:hypothetical protein